MTRKQPNEQNIRRYRYHTTSAVSYPIVSRRASSQPGELREQRSYVVPASTGRRVSTDQKQVPPLTAAERHARGYNLRAKQPAQHPLVARTYLQTGHAAPVGQLRTNRPLPTRRTGRSMPTPRRRVSRQFLRRLFGFLVVLAVIGGGISFALSSPAFHVQQVHINGTQNAGLITAIQHIGIQGQDIFLLNQAMLQAHLEALPLVNTASLDIQLPNTVTVNIQERVPVLLWQRGQTTFGLGQDGIAIAPVSELGVKNNLVTVVDKRQGVNMHAGGRIDAAQIAFAQQLVRQLPDMPGVAPFTLQYVDHITVNGQSEPANQAGAGCYIVVSAHGWLAYMGDAVNSNSLDNRLLELRQILDIAQQGHVQLATIDLRFGLRPTYTLQS